jgi:hypothetical protein
LADHEVKLLARLVQNFPGANIRIVLLLGTSVQSRKVFDSFDRRMLRWDIEAPTPEQAEVMLTQGREDGCEGAVKILLKKLEAPVPGAPVMADPAGIDPLGFQSPLAHAPASTAVFTFSGGTDKGRAKVRSGKADKSSKSKLRDRRDVSARARPSVWRWVLSILLLASLSVGITAWLHPTVFAIDRDDLAQRWASLTAKYATAPATPAPAPAVVPAPVVEPAPVPEAPTPAAPAVTEEAAPPAPAPAQPIAGIIEPAAEALEDQAWVNAMPPGSFVVQHAAMPSFQAAAAWKKGVPALAKARIVAVYRPREKLAYFVVISGPFTTRAQANESNTVRGKPAGAWVRTSRSIRDQFNPEPVAAGQSQESPR